MKKSNKVIIFLVVFLFAILFFNTKSFAATPIKFSNGETYEFDFSNCELKENYFIILSEKTPTISIFTWDNSVKFYATSSNRFLSDNGPFSYMFFLSSTIPPISNFGSTSSLTFGSSILGYCSNVNVTDKTVHLLIILSLAIFNFLRVNQVLQQLKKHWKVVILID